MLNGHNSIIKGAPILQPCQSGAGTQQSANAGGNKPVQIGSTWSNSGGLDINIDDLSISGRGNGGSSNSTPMNQMIAPAIIPIRPAFPGAAIGSVPYPAGAPMLGYGPGFPTGVQQPAPQQLLGAGPAYFQAFK